MDGASWNCCRLGANSRIIHHTTMHQFKVSQDAYMLSFNLPLALWAEWLGSFTCYCGNTGVERLQKWESAQTVDPGEMFSETWPLPLQRPVLFTTGVPSGDLHVNMTTPVTYRLQWRDTGHLDSNSEWRGDQFRAPQDTCVDVICPRFLFFFGGGWECVAYTSVCLSVCLYINDDCNFIFTHQ